MISRLRMISISFSFLLIFLIVVQTFNSCVVRLDETPPKLLITRPLEGQILGVATHTIEVSYNDANNVSQVGLYIDGVQREVQPASGTSGTVRFSWVINESEREGSRTITVMATDIANNAGVANRRIVVDVTKPSVNIILPTDNATLSGIVTVEASASDNIALDRLVLFLNDQKVAETSQQPYQFALDTRTRSDGRYVLKITAFDKASNQESKTLTVSISNRRPSVQIINPRNNAIIESDIDVVLSLTNHTEISKVECYLDSTILSSVTNPSSTTVRIPLPLSNVSIGEHVLYAKVYDRTSQLIGTSDRVKFFVSKNFVVEFRRPVSGTFVRGNVPVEINATSDAGVNKVELYYNAVSGTPVRSWNSPPYQFVWDTTTFATGQVTLVARAYGVSGITKDASVTVNIDNQAPVVTILNPKRNSSVAGLIDLEASATDNSGIDRVEFYTGSEVVYAVTSPPFRVANFNIEALGTGNRTIRVVAVDLAGNRAEAAVTVAVVSGVSINPTPDRADFVGGVVNFELAVPTSISVSKVDWYLSAATTTKITTTTASPHRIQFTSSQFTDGVYYLEAQVQDQLGSVFKAQRRLKIDNTRPEVSVVSPVPNSTVRGNVELLADARDNFEIGRVQFFYRQGGGTWIQIGSDVTAPPYRVLWTTGGLASGNYTILVRAQDRADNIRDQTFNVIVASTPNVGQVVWSFPTAGAVWSSPALGSNGTVYIGSDSNRFNAINPDGTLRWNFTTGGNIYSSPAVGPDGTVYVGCDDRRMYAFNPDGTKKWEYTTGGMIKSSPAIGADGTIYFGSLDRVFYALNPNGTLRWSTPVNAEIHSSPAIGADGTIYFGADNGRLYAFEPSGTKKWEYLTGGAVRSSPAIGSDGTIYVGSDDWYVYALNPNGTLKWRTYLNGQVRSSPVIGADGTIYVGTLGSTLYAVSLSGSIRWQRTLDSRIESTPVLGVDGRLYVATYNGTLYALDRSNGNVVWQTNLGGSVVSSPTIDPNGNLYVGVGTGQNRVVSVYTGSQGVARTAWPKFRHFTRNEGNVLFDFTNAEVGIGLPYIPGVRNLRAVYRANENKLIVSYEYPNVANSRFLVFRKNSEESVFRKIGETTELSFVIDNITLQEVQRIQFIGVNVIVDGKESGIRTVPIQIQN